MSCSSELLDFLFFFTLQLLTLTYRCFSHQYLVFTQATTGTIYRWLSQSGRTEQMRHSTRGMTQWSHKQFLNKLTPDAPNLKSCTLLNLLAELRLTQQTCVSLHILLSAICHRASWQRHNSACQHRVRFMLIYLFILPKLQKLWSMFLATQKCSLSRLYMSLSSTASYGYIA